MSAADATKALTAAAKLDNSDQLHRLLLDNCEVQDHIRWLLVQYVKGYNDLVARVRDLCTPKLAAEILKD